MRKILGWLTAHLREEFEPRTYAAVGLFLAVAIAVNYRLDFEDSVLDHLPGPARFAGFFATHFVAWIVPVLLAALLAGRTAPLRSRELWWKSAFAIALLSYDRSSYFAAELAAALLHPAMRAFSLKLHDNLLGLFTMILPFVLPYLLQDRREGHLYGLRPSRFDVRPYLQALLVMAPILVVASFFPSFQRQYPMWKATTAHLHLGVPEWVTTAAYELAYGLNFVSIEFFFRGFLVLGMASALGRGAVLPMASLYCVMHFGKPMGEAIGAAFGGYVLGVVALQTRGVWGGVIVHVGVAWAMEALAFAQRGLAARGR